jgi:hypothetical protein
MRTSPADRLDHLSLFHYMALAPAQDPDPLTLAITTACGLGLGVMATIVFDHRDVHSDRLAAAPGR